MTTEELDVNEKTEKKKSVLDDNAATVTDGSILTIRSISNSSSPTASIHQYSDREEGEEKNDISSSSDSSSSHDSLDTIAATTEEKDIPTTRRRCRALTVTQNNTRPLTVEQKLFTQPDQSPEEDRFDVIDIHEQIHELDDPALTVPGNHDNDRNSCDNSDSESFTSVEESRHKRHESYRSTMSSIHSYVSSASNYDVLLARLGSASNIKDTPSTNPPGLVNHISPTTSIMTTDKQLLEETGNYSVHDKCESSPAEEDNDFDWEFWSKLILDFNSTVKSEPKMLSNHIERGGIPPSLRGMIWQLLAKSKNLKLEETYMQLLKSESVYEKAIVRDLPKVINSSFAENNMQSDDPLTDQQENQREALFNIIKAYSLYDTDVGYSQALLHIVSPLLLNMPEEEVFCVLVQLMNKYDLRAHFLPRAELLSQRLHQLEGLISDQLPHVQRHFEKYGIKSTTYAYPWFSTLFAFKFPLDAVYRIYDMIFAKGITSLFSLALALLNRNQSTILSLEFDDLTNFLKNELLEAYHGDLNQLIKDAFQFRFTIKRLNRLAKDFQVQSARANSEAEAIEALKRQNKSLSESIQKLDTDYNKLNNEHNEVATELITAKMNIARIHDENETLKQQANDLKKTLETLPAEVEARVKEEMEVLYTKNVALVERNSALEDQLAYMENMIIEITEKYSESEKEREGLRQRLIDLKRLMG